MPYSAQISRTNPACILLLIDQSESMAQPISGGAPEQTKSVTVADAVNRLLQNLVLRSAKADGIRDYFHVGVIGYGQTVSAGLGGTIPHDVAVPISRLGNNPVRVEVRKKLVSDGTGGLVEQSVKFPVWFDPDANGRTPMCEAVSVAGLAVKAFADRYPNAFPPLVLNLTDGMPSDGNPQANARLLRGIRTTDGNALLFNLLISSDPIPPMYFPADEERLPDKFAKLLFRMSSELPAPMVAAARADGFSVAAGARGVVYNADPTAVVRFLDIGTRVAPSGR